MILDSFKLTGKVAIVTGCSRGLGRGWHWGWRKPGRMWSEWLRAVWNRPELGSKASAGDSRHPAGSVRKAKALEEIVKNDRPNSVRLHPGQYAGIIRRADAVDFTEKGLG